MKLQNGQQFNPHHKVCGFYPPDIISRRREVNDGPKRLYDRLVRWSGGKGYCWYGFERIALELGKSERQVRSDMTTLECLGLVSHRKRDGRKSNTYVFLWHPWLENAVAERAEECPDHEFERQSTAGQNQPEGNLSGSPLPVKPLQHEKDDAKLPVASGSPLPVKTDLSGSPPPPNRVTIEYKKEELSSSSGGPGIGQGDDATTNPFSEKTKPKTPASTEILPGAEDLGTDWRTPEVERQTMEALHCHRFRVAAIGGGFEYNSSVGARPDLAIVRQIQSNFTSLQDQLDWLTDLAERNEGRRIRSYGFYAADARTWPERRDLVAEQRRLRQAAQVTAEEAEDRRRAEELFREEQRRQVTQARLARAATPDCPDCGRRGVVSRLRDDVPAVYSWCKCEHADFARQDHGDDYPSTLTRAAARDWSETLEARRRQRQDNRWEVHHSRNKKQGMTDAFRQLDVEFAFAELDRRDEILAQLDTELANLNRAA